MGTITVVTAPVVSDTGVIDYTFLWHAPPAAYSNPWGTLAKISGTGHINLFRAVQDGDFSSPEYRWDLQLFRSSGRILSSGVDDGPSLEGLIQMLRDAATQDINLLVEEALLPELVRAAERARIKVEVYHANRPLATSGNSHP